ncbi:DUF349 domain-containing protein [Thalassotalea atypica]|uniref:DUF349 domain-containing protein n=1 Tax=Thalassotalea atypica TaxID=2054316 RepID=UPI0025740FE1|nr:DUF349 domain-containing protein [Thalassotalea atypica]
MIFSKLFNSKAQWQHKNSNIRIAAIKDELQLSNSQDVQVLKRLASEDENDLVRRSALIKLNDFSVWLKAFEQEKNSSVKNFAYDNLINILASDSSDVYSKENKLSYIEQHITTSMAEKVLEKANCSTIIIALIDKINKPQTWPSLFVKKTDLTVQQYILSQTSDINTLEKLLKKADGDAVKSLIKEKLAIIALEKEKPVKLLKDTQMVLSKLLALKEQNDYELVLEKRTLLNDEWNWLVQDFACLSQSDKEQALIKYSTINEQLDKAFAHIKEQFEQAQIVRKLDEQKEQTIKEFREKLSTYNQLIANAVFENQEIDEIALKNELDEILVEIEHSALNNKEKSNFTEQFSKQLQKLEQIPEIAESVTKATHLISKISQQLPPETMEQFTERSAYFNEWQKQWRAVEAVISGVIPQSIADAKAQIDNQWREALAPLQKEQKQLFNQAQKKVAELKRLISTGKYNASFGVFKRLKKIFEQLSNHHQHRLQRDYDQLNEKLTELSDWEHYIATPRKQQLLEEVQKLAAQPLDNPNEQANQVKQYRKIWNSLGHADEDVDQAFNDSFNDALEKAFAPCRLWYAEQEKTREQHLVIRNQLVEQAKSLGNEYKHDNMAVKHVEVSLNKLLLAWKDAGDVDRTIYQKLNKQFIDAIKPVKTYIFDYHQDNAQLKDKLIEQVKAQHNNEDIYDAVNQVKVLQSKWKSIGYAGAKLENKLWNEFRKANDVIFAQRDEEKSKHQSDIDARVEKVSAVITAYEQRIQTTTTKTELQMLGNTLNELRDQQLQKKPVLKQIMVKIEAQQKLLDDKIKALNANLEKQSWLDTFAILEKLSSGNLSIEQLENVEEFIALPHVKQKRLIDALTKENGGDRLVKTIELEVMAGVESPASDQATRMQVQVELMQEKMTSGQSVDLNKAFVDWIAVAHIGEDDQAYLARIKPIFIK